MVTWNRPDRERQEENRIKKRVKADTYDFGLFFVVLTLVLFGVVMIFSASYYETMSSKEYGYDMFYYLKRQGMWAVVGTVGMSRCHECALPALEEVFLDAVLDFQWSAGNPAFCREKCKRADPLD